MDKINIARPFYTMATQDGNKAEISLYGEIVDQQPTDFWGDPIKGEFSFIKFIN